MQLTDNTRAFIESEQYSQFILMNLHDGLLPETFWRNVSDFAHGTTLNIKTIGSVTLQEAEEDAPLIYNPIESGNITFRIKEYKGDAWYVTDDLREDGAQIDQLMAARASESTRAIQETFETDFLSTIGDFYVANTGPNNVNGFPHQVVSVATGNVIKLDHFIRMRLAFDKANVPAEGRVAIVDPVVETTLAKYVTLTSNITPYAVAIIEGGLARGQRFVHSIYGWDIITSNRLPVRSYNDGTTTFTGVANIFMSVLDDQTKPVMGAWRRMPKSEGERNKDRARDEFVVRCRYGFGVQRSDTLGIVVTSTTNITPDLT
ncbi:Phage protein [Pseudomonas phage GP100]|nr:Phage protein [Pseudomonas phage GP100]